MLLTLILALFLPTFVERTKAEVPKDAFQLDKGVIVHLFEWKWNDIAHECEVFLGPKGFKAVQISPPTENLVIAGRPWYERYQVVSYKLETRSGTVQQLADMIRRCNKVGVRIFADVVINHMTADTTDCRGTAGSTCDSEQRSYPAVPYNITAFHYPFCAVKNWTDEVQIRECDIFGLHDLNQTAVYVRETIVEFLNQLVDLGVAGLRLDAAKHIYPSDLKVIFSRLHDLNTDHGFSNSTKPLIYQEIYNRPGVFDPIARQYHDFGLVTDFTYGFVVSNTIKGKYDLKTLKDIGESSGLGPDNQILVFIENHDTERGESDILTYKDPLRYKMAVAFLLSWPYGSPQVMSSFNFTDTSASPPHDLADNILSPRPILSNNCSNGWVCQHRWRQVYGMVAFHNIVKGTEVQNWWDNGKNQISYCRGNRGFIAFNLESFALNQTLQTCLPKGIYCDVISGSPDDYQCTGKTVTVAEDGTAPIFIEPLDQSKPEKDGVLAIHVQSKIITQQESVCDKLGRAIRNTPDGIPLQFYRALEKRFCS